MNISANKRVIAAASVFAVVFIVLMALGISRRSDATAQNAWLEETQSRFDELREQEYPPTAKSLKTLNEADKTTERNVVDMLGMLDTYRAASAPKRSKLLSPQGYMAQVKAAVLRFGTLARENSVRVSTGAAKLGMGQYETNTYAGVEEAPILSFQLKAVEKVAESIVKNGGVAVNKVYCSPIPEGAVAPPGKSTKRDWVTLPFEISFEATHGTLSSVLNDMINDQEFCYLISALRVSTPNPLPSLSPYTPPPTAESLAATGEDLGTGASDEKKQGENGDNVRVIAKQVLGNGTVQVHLALEVIYFQSVSDRKIKK